MTIDKVEGNSPLYKTKKTWSQAKFTFPNNKFKVRLSIEKLFMNNICKVVYFLPLKKTRCSC